ncbi:MAG: DUF4215 domain-containing protein [Polyangiaceae bacterium]|nr:DUF4215 domain-containing protein [Polyangiaceae bacterium]
MGIQRSKQGKAVRGHVVRRVSPPLLLRFVAAAGLAFVASCGGDDEAPPSRCGDGVVDDGEECDDGNPNDRDDCTTLCLSPRCGDGFVQAGEDCDDRDFDDHDACRNDCTLAECGDGVVRTGLEACDDGNDDDADGCRRDCALPTCGDGVVQTGEACDDGNSDDRDACTRRCLEPACGDGVVQGEEACDDGNPDDRDACRNDCTLAECGDGVVRTGLEACDDGNDDDTDGCRRDCALPTCGDGVVQAGEACDDGNRDDRDTCTSRCLEPTCGDGVVQDGEDCDDGNAENGDACLNDCSLATCGDGAVRLGLEACDDANDEDDDTCRSDCALPSCGDGVVQDGEACDDGNRDDTDGCTNRCLEPGCGDGLVQVAEACDDGNASNQDACLNDCTIAACGDGYLRLGMEACDDGNQDDGDGCRRDCALPSCGDRVVQAGEQCDDGNDDDGDGCVGNCQVARCGDGVLWRGVEACDDGNRTDGDGCTSDCHLPGCGDGVVRTPEVCDDGNASNADLCLTTCQAARCGDGFRGPDEECDDGNTSGADACLTDCTAATCGDGLLWAGVEACDDGNRRDGDGCRSDCTLPSCGNGVIEPFEACDDANRDNTDGCLMTCRTLDWCEHFGIADVVPPVACSSGASPGELILTASGRGFVEIDGVVPIVTWDGIEVTATLLDATCVPVSGAMVAARACTSLTVEVPIAAPMPVGDYEIGVTNPVTQRCSATATFSVAPPPSVTGITPGAVCADIELTLDLTGSGFAAGTEVTLVHQVSGMSYPTSSTEVASGGASMQATWDAGIPAGDYDLVVSNGAGCESTIGNAMTVHPRPIIFFIDPPVIYNALDFQATLYVANINGGAVNAVEARRVGTSSFQTVAHVYDPVTPSQVQATFPANLVGADEQFAYEVTLEDAYGCPATLSGVTELTQRVTMADFRVEPPFGGTAENAAVSVLIDDPATGVPFEEVPRVYLNPTSGGALAEAVSSVGFLDGTELSALVPAGLAVGSYQVIVANPDGTVGVGDMPFTVHTIAPPIIESISPGSVRVEGSSDDFRTVRVLGQNLDGVATVVLRCQDPLGAETSYDGTVMDQVAGGFRFLAPDTITLDSVCIVRAANANGAYSDYSALVALNGAENIPPVVQATQAMTTVRRAPVALVGSLSSTARFLYAIGGDLGTEAAALASVEAIGLSPFGELKGSFVQRPIDLPEARTLAQGVNIGRFLYVLGGDSGTGAVGTGHRAEVLRVEDAPQIAGELSIALDPAGLGAGLWYYRVSAVMGPSDPDNPNGETLPSEPLPITVPTWAPENFALTLRWSPVPGAAEYRVYRSPTAGAALSALAVIATTTAGDPGTSVDDVLTLTDESLPAGSERPRILGDLGEWVALPAMGTPRSSYGITVATDPADPTVRHIYALGGVDDAGTILETFEFLTLTVESDGAQTVGGWTPGADTFGAKRLLSAFSVDGFVTPMIVPIEATWVLAGPGTSPASGGAAYDVSRFQSAQVQAGGQLTAWGTANNQSIDRYAYAAVAISNQVFLMGGRSSGAIVDDRTSGMVLTATGDVTGGIVSINNTPGDLVTPREYVGSVLGSGRIFVLGGNTDAGVTDTIETMPW